MLFHLSYVAQVCFLVATLTYPRLRTPCVDVGYLFVVTHNTSNPNCAVTYIHPIPTNSSNISNGSTNVTSSAATSTTVPATNNRSSTTSSTNKTVQEGFYTERVFYNGDVFGWPAQGGEPYAQEDQGCEEGLRTHTIIAAGFTVLALVFTMASYVLGVYAKEVVHGKNCPKMRRYSKHLAWSTVLFMVVVWISMALQPCPWSPLPEEDPEKLPQTFFTHTAGAVFAVLTCIGSCVIGFASSSARPGTPKSQLEYQKPLWAYCSTHSHSPVKPSRKHDPTILWACKSCQRAEKKTWCFSLPGRPRLPCTNRPALPPPLAQGPKYYCATCKEDHCSKCVQWLPWRIPAPKSRRELFWESLKAKAKVEASSEATDIQLRNIISSNVEDNDTPLLISSDQQPLAESSGQETPRNNTETEQSPSDRPEEEQQQQQQQAALPAHLDLPAVSLIEHYLTSVGVQKLRCRGGWGSPRSLTGSGPHHLDLHEDDLLNGDEMSDVYGSSDPFIDVSRLRGNVVLVYVSASRFENENRVFTDLLRDFYDAAWNTQVQSSLGLFEPTPLVNVLWLSDDLTDQQFEDSFNAMDRCWLSLVNSTTGQMTLPSQWTDNERELNAKLLNIFFPPGPAPGAMDGEVPRRNGGPSLSVFTADGRHMCVEAMSQLGFPKHTLPDRSFRPHFPRNRQTCDIVQEELEKTQRRLAVAPPAACGCLIVAFAASLFWLNDQPENQNAKKMTLVGLGSLFVLTPLVPTILWPELRSLDTLRWYSQNTLREKIRKYFLNSNITLAAFLTVAGSIWGVVATNTDIQGWFWISWLIYSLDIALAIRIAMVLTSIPNKIRGFLGLSEDQRPPSDAAYGLYLEQTRGDCPDPDDPLLGPMLCMSSIVMLPFLAFLSWAFGFLGGNSHGWWSTFPVCTYVLGLAIGAIYISKFVRSVATVRAHELSSRFVTFTLSLVMLGALALATELAVAFSAPVPESIPALPRNVTNRNEFGAYIQRPYDLSFDHCWQNSRGFRGLVVFATLQALVCLGSIFGNVCIGIRFCAVLRFAWDDRLLAEVSRNLTPQLAGRMILDNMTQRPAEKEQDSDDAEVVGDVTGAPEQETSNNNGGMSDAGSSQPIGSTTVNVAGEAAEGAAAVVLPMPTTSAATTNSLLTVPGNSIGWTACDFTSEMRSENPLARNTRDEDSDDSML